MSSRKAMATALITAITAFTGIARIAGRKARRAAGVAARQCCRSAIATGKARIRIAKLIVLSTT
jgi:hypothetical protein